MEMCQVTKFERWAFYMRQYVAVSNQVGRCISLGPSICRQDFDPYSIMHQVPIGSTFSWATISSVRVICGSFM